MLLCYRKKIMHVYFCFAHGSFVYRVIDEDALEQALAAAVTCTILAAAGPQRSRVLATLYKVNFLLVLMETNLVTNLVSVLLIIFFFHVL